ncbi:unnamed protein product [Phytophthora lilii]|uniref:Unnamed protein product n=1 Tax=Phytophthora lilii TaxID=2077276 RepID=A0A9W6TWD0_9STRA|nr:unnamed protein product [Phytophthora lilii]
MESIGDANGNLDTYKQQAKQIMKRLDQRSPTKCSIESGAYTFQYGSLGYEKTENAELTLTRGSYKFIQKKRKEYADPNSSQNMHRLNDDLADIHNIMRKNIQEVLNRGERVERKTLDLWQIHLEDICESLLLTMSCCSH